MCNPEYFGSGACSGRLGYIGKGAGSITDTYIQPGRNPGYGGKEVMPAE